MVTPLLFVGERMTRFEHALTDDPVAAAALIRDRTTVCVPTFECAAEILRLLGADEEHIAGQIHWAQTGSVSVA